MLESPELSLKIARECRSVCDALGFSYVFKASFDKANRTSVRSYRGLALDDGLVHLARVRDELGVPVLTDVHERQQIPSVAEVADVIQIPAFLSRQTDLLLAAAASGRAINVKKGQFLAPWDMRHVVEKIEAGGATEILLMQNAGRRSATTPAVDFCSLPQMLVSSGHPVVFDATQRAATRRSR